MGLLLGAKDLGLSTVWRFGFVGFGHRAETTPGVVYFDVGGSVKPGVLDHHGDTTRGDCAADLVFRNPELVYNHLMGHWLQLHDEGRVSTGAVWTPTLITHAQPDWDCVVATFLATHLVEEGQFPPYAEALVGYTRQVDQGRYKLRCAGAMGEIPLEELFAPHIGYLAVQNLTGPDGKPVAFEAQLRRGHALLRRIVELISNARTEAKKGPIRSPDAFLPRQPGVASWRSDPWFSDITLLLEQEREKYAADKAGARIVEKMRVPAADGDDPVQVRAFILERPPQSVLNKYWVRADPDGYGLFVCPYDQPQAALGGTGISEGTFNRVVISVDPNPRADGRTPTLRGLGFALEQAEAARRRALHDGADDRGGAPRFPDGYCGNDDPWYDGRAFDYTIVDAPRSGTRLAYEEILGIITASRYWETPLRNGAVTLIWVERDAVRTAVSESGLRPFEGMADTLRKFYAACSESNQPAPGHLALPEGCSAIRTVRHFPPGTSPSMHMVRVEAGSGSTLEGIVAARSRVVAEMGKDCPDYVLSRISLGTHFSDPARIAALLRQLADSEIKQLEGTGGTDEVVLFNSRTLIFREGRAGLPRPKPDPDLEILLYVAFLNEALVAFSNGIAAKVPEDESQLAGLDTEELRRDFLRFQTSYYQIEVSRLARGRLLFSQLAESLDLVGQYSEVQSELDRLAQLENQLAEERKARAESIMEAVLYVVAVGGIYQTIAAFFGLGDALRSKLLWGVVTSVTAMAVGIYFAVLHYRKNKRPAE